ncbi:hypothetical protein TL16_g09619 [Triparma laevis f. inornata]|uniref:Uncharacterized protein n=1 Tax=Triparma laevis f. inornata TaxID=1714386 RepID=A0A9W7BBL3_9STRA|nr:hypothetical protein TL16_g09619 [Triparma laevis f. inornata]
MPSAAALLSILACVSTLTYVLSDPGQTRYLVIPGASGFKVDSLTGSVDLYEFLPPAYKENRGHVGSWLTKAPAVFSATLWANEVLPKFIYNETLAQAQSTFEAENMTPDLNGPLSIPTDYAFYNSQSNKARRLEMVFDSILNSTGPLFIMGTSEGGAIIQKLLESEELVGHMVANNHRVAIISPAYAVGDESLPNDPFYKRAKLNPDCWYITQPATYQKNVPIHVINTDIGFAGVQGMRDNTNGVDLSVYNNLLMASVDESTSSTLTWDYYPGAPHSFPTCNIRRTEDADKGMKNGVDVQGRYEGSLDERASGDLVALFKEMSEGVTWSESPRDWWSKDAFKDENDNSYHPSIDETFSKARQDEIDAARSAGFVGEDDDVIIANRVKVWEEADIVGCVWEVEEERAVSRV